MQTLKDCGYKKTNLMLSFFVSTLTRLDEAGVARYNRLRKSGYKICAAAFGEEYNSLDVFAQFNFDYLRCESAYFTADDKKRECLPCSLPIAKPTKWVL